MNEKKTRLQLTETLICRTPAFGINDDLQNHWPKLKDLIKEASPEFYRMIAGLDYDQFTKADAKVRFSVWKYFNRARFRSTPFGNFAAISFAPVQTNDNIDEPFRISSSMLSHRFNDWAEKDDHLQSANKIVQASEWFQSNSTWYIVGEQLRYVRYTDNQFELATVVVFDELTHLLSACRSKQRKQAIYELMHSAFKMQPRSVDNMLCQLIECQLLMTENMPNIIGEDYFKRLSLPQKSNDHQYIIAKRVLKSSCPNTIALNFIPEYLDFAKDFIPQTQNLHLKTFKQEFKKRFDLKAIPLSIALDPETGIGYGDMAQAPQASALSAIFANKQKTEAKGRSFTYMPQHRFLLNALITGDTIRLETYKSPHGENSPVMPNTFNVMFHYWNTMPVLQNAGGCTANALLGRFTLGCEEAEKLANSIVHTEEAANPDVLFFDIAFQAEKQVDNVNRRKQIYRYELSILTWSCADLVLSMDDIWVMVRNDEIILWSKQHQKRLMPRIATAYNYNRSDLAVYRFLCDLQHQNIKSDLTFSLQQLFPGLDRYPRVMYKNIIVAAAIWKFSPQTILSGDKAKNMVLLKNWLQSNNINNHFKCGNADQTLCFNPKSMQDIEAFLTWCRQNNERDIYIQEALIDETSLIIDENGKQYLPQYIAGYFHTNRIYRTLQSYAYLPAIRPTSSTTFLPGSEWLYFEIYSHPLRANDILDQYISPVINSMKRNVKKWFFIRYSDPKPHIRLRLQLKETAFTGNVIAEVNKALQPLWENDFISDIQIKTYLQETERYGQSRMDCVEHLFYQDSKYVVRLLAKNYSIHQIYHLTLGMMKRLYALAFENIDDRLRLIKIIADRFGDEFFLTNEDYKTINKSFENFRADKRNYIATLSEPFQKQYCTIFCNILKQCRPNEKAHIVADIIHMHINRVFSTDQRMHEAILYQYLQKLVKTQKCLATAEPALL